ncbi:MAG: DUF975 family protein [Prevotellaceae bacterium]|jgi:uncharacterized membrane protein|nr:DUF975 family protein [Prevotellaceae bacterium]
MITKNKVLMAQACASLSGKWGIAVCSTLAYGAICGLVGSITVVGGVWDNIVLQQIFQYAVMLLVIPPFTLGFIMFYLALSRGEKVSLDLLFKGFNSYTTALVANFLVFIFVFLWTLLLIVPGIIAYLAYSQVFYIIADNPEISAMEALRRSKNMMRGYKWKLFCLGLRFIGWILLGVLTLGIGYFWLLPYMQTSYTKFYDDLMANQGEYNI